jgi:hypothetical protein
MAIQTLQASRAISVIPDDNIVIPMPYVAASGTKSAGTFPTTLEDVTATFITDNVKVGDVVYNTTNVAIATVTSVNSETELTMSAGLGGLTADDYTIYTAGNNNSCLIYVGVGGDVAIETSAGDQVTLVGLPTGSFVPVHLVKVRATGTTATSIIALW